MEVLVAVTVTSVGTLGMAGLMTVSSRVNRGALEHTQASIAAQSLVESMHVNPIAVRSGDYEGSYGGSSSFVDCRNQPCAPVQAAGFDRARFMQSLAATLPNARADVRCDSAGGSAPSYNTCRLQIDWSSHGQVSSGGVAPQTLVWVFEP